MIAYINGKIINKNNGYAVILAGNIGYKVFLDQILYNEISVGQEIEVNIYEHVKEDALDLYGFKSADDMALFEMLLSVSGIGPKTAQSVMSVGEVCDIRNSIAGGDALMLTKVSGIGKKTAERVILELREKVISLPAIQAMGRPSPAGADEIDALIALGYSLSQAREALGQVDPKITNSGDRVREALKRLGGR